jgi:hypothetical protein
MPFEGNITRGGGAAMPLRCWSDAQLAQVEGLFAACWRAWTAAWQLAAPAGVVRASRIEDWAGQRQLGWQALHCGAHHERRAWLALEQLDRTPAPAQLLSDALFDAPASGAIAAEVGQAAWRDLLQSVAQAAGIAGAADGSAGMAPTGSDCGPWCGALQLELPLRGASVSVLLGGSCVAALVTPPAACAPGTPPRRPALALARQQLWLQAALAPVELSLGSLQRLAVGDVVVLPHPLGEALIVTGADGGQLCSAHLGQQAGYRALELLSSAREFESMSVAAPATL